MVTTMQGALPVCSKKVQVSIRRSIGKWHRKNKMSAKGNSGAHMIIEISILEKSFLFATMSSDELKKGSHNQRIPFCGCHSDNY